MIAQFAFRLMAGISLMWAVMPRSDVTAGFFRIQMMLVLGLSVLGGLTAGEYAVPLEQPLIPTGVVQTLCGISAVVAYVGSVLWTLNRRKGGTACVFLILGLSTVCSIATVASATALQTAAGWLAVLSELSTAAILGGAMTGMLLGHWYLTAPTMSIRPLSTLTLYFGAAAAVRLVLSAIALVAYWDGIAGSTELTWLTLRWAAGVLGPLAVFVMTWRILKYRNTQSATGVLFVGVILTFLGELSALLLYRELKIPL